MAAVIRLAAVGGAPKAEESGRIGIGAYTKVVPPADARAGELRRDVAGEVKQWMVCPLRWPKEACIVWICPQETAHEIGANLVVGLTDHRSERRPDMWAGCTERFHGGDRCLDHAGEGAPPAGVRCADHPGLGVRQQDRPAIGG